MYVLKVILNNKEIKNDLLFVYVQKYNNNVWF